MKRIKLPFILVSLLLTVFLFGASNKIDLTATIGSKALVGFENLSTASQNGSLFVNNSLNSLNFGTTHAGETHKEISRPIYVSTNNESGVNMILQDNTNNGDLTHSSGDRIKMDYSFDGQDIIIGIPFRISSGKNKGSTPVGEMVFKPNSSSKDNTIGTYTTTLSVIISAN